MKRIISLLLASLFTVSYASRLPLSVSTSTPTPAAQPSPTPVPVIAIPTNTATPTATDAVNVSDVPPNCTIPGAIWTDPTDMARLVCVPAGDFIMGSSEENLIAYFKREELLDLPIYLDTFWMDEREVSVGQFQQFVNETGYLTEAEQARTALVMNVDDNRWYTDPEADWRHPRGAASAAEPTHPVTQVSWNDASAYCQWAGRSLPTEAQWEKTARGRAGAVFPWEHFIIRQYTVDCLNANISDRSLGAKFSKTGCDDGYKFTAPVDSVIATISWTGKETWTFQNPYNALNMLGNVNEWVLDDWNGAMYSSIARRNPVNLTDSKMKCLRGGSWGNVIEKSRFTNRDYDAVYAAVDTVGFRCAHNPEQ